MFLPFLRIGMSHFSVLNEIEHSDSIFCVLSLLPKVAKIKRKLCCQNVCTATMFAGRPQPVRSSIPDMSLYYTIDN
ncbi:MAG: hypothetical protein NVS2B12_25020 [Ktedonobacteraceae bacterium]